MFAKKDAEGYSNPLKGIDQKTLVHGSKTLMTEFVLQKGSILPMHSHPHEQTGYLVSGHMRLTIGGERFEVKPRDSWCIAGGIVHGADILEDSIAVEVFAPVREEYLPKGKGRRMDDANI